MSLIEVAEKLNSLGIPFNEKDCLIFHEGFERGLKLLKALKEKNLEDENLENFRKTVLSIYGFDVLNTPEDVLRKNEERLEGFTEEEKIKFFLEAMEDEKYSVPEKNLWGELIN